MEDRHGNKKTFPEGHFIGLWMGIGIAIFSGVWMPLSIALGKPGLIAFGPAIGVAIGVAIGTSVEANAKKEGRIRPREKSDNNKASIWLVAGIALLLLLLLLGLFFWIKA